MCHDEEDGLLLLVQRQQQLAHAVGRIRIEVTRRLVAQHDLWLTDERAGNGDALLLAAGKRRRPMVQPRSEPHLIKQSAGALGRRRIGLAHQCRDENVLQHGALREQAMILKHEADLAIPERRERLGRELVRILTRDTDRAARGRLESANDVEQGALARSRRPHHRRRFPPPQGERRLGEHLQRPGGRAVGLRKTLRF